MAEVVFVIDAIIKAFNASEEARKNKEKAKYEEKYWEMQWIWRNNTEKLRELEKLREHAETTWANFKQNMDYIPPALKVDAFPIQYRDRIMEATSIPSASISGGLLDSNVSLSTPNTVNVPELPPIQQYYAIGGPLDNTALYQIARDTHSAMDEHRQRFEDNFRDQMNRMNTFY